MKDNAVAVHAFITEVLTLVKDKYQNVKEVIYFSVGLMISRHKQWRRRKKFVDTEFWCRRVVLFNSIQFYLYSAFNKGALSQSCFTENRPQWVSQGQQWQGKTPWQITGRNLEQNQTQRGTICRWLAPVLVQCVESVLSPVMLGWGDSGRMRVPSWSRLDLRARRGRSGDLG